jgi:hypothetical protein
LSSSSHMPAEEDWLCGVRARTGQMENASYSGGCCYCSGLGGKCGLGDYIIEHVLHTPMPVVELLLSPLVWAGDVADLMPCLPHSNSTRSGVLTFFHSFHTSLPSLNVCYLSSNAVFFSISRCSYMSWHAQSVSKITRQ